MQALHMREARWNVKKTIAPKVIFDARHNLFLELAAFPQVSCCAVEKEAAQQNREHTSSI